MPMKADWTGALAASSPHRRDWPDRGVRRISCVESAPETGGLGASYFVADVCQFPLHAVAALGLLRVDDGKGLLSG